MANVVSVSATRLAKLVIAAIGVVEGNDVRLPAVCVPLLLAPMKLVLVVPGLIKAAMI
ncbi:MAG: hypothetical protein ACLQVJ_28300 [Syntrophobacteraceae bacterium]